MKKFLALLLAAMMLLSLSAAFAEETPVAPSTTEARFTKKWLNAVPTADTLTFKTEFVMEKVTGSTTAPDVAVVPATIELKLDGTHTDGVFEVPFTVTAPNEYGTYIYKITEVIPDGAEDGPVSYDKDALYIAVMFPATELSVSLTNEPVNTQGRAEDVEPSEKPDGKNDQFVNQYDVGSFQVTKVITGNAANLEDRFVVAVTFTSDVTLDNLSMTWSSNLDDEDTDNPIQITKLEAGKPVTINVEIGNGETIFFDNVPVGVKASVEETKQVGKDDLNFYEATYKGNDITVVSGDSSTITITNTKKTELPTGLELDSIPYVVMLAVAVLGAVGFIVKRRLVAADED